MATFPANEQPAEASSNGFDDIPRIERIYQCFPTQETPLVFHLAATKTETRSIDRVVDELVMFLGVRFPREGKDVENGEDGHFSAQQHAGNANFEVGISDFRGRFERSGGRGQKG